MRKCFLKVGFQIWKLRSKMWDKITDFVLRKQRAFMFVPDRYKECQPPFTPFDF